MDEKQRMRVMTRAIEWYGVKFQKKKAREELTELLLALEQEETKPNKVVPADVITEIADVTIMVKQLATIYGEVFVQAEIDRKLERLERRIEREAMEIQNTEV